MTSGDSSLRIVVRSSVSSVRGLLPRNWRLREGLGDALVAIDGPAAAAQETRRDHQKIEGAARADEQAKQAAEQAKQAAATPPAASASPPSAAPPAPAPVTHRSHRSGKSKKKTATP